VSGCSVSVCLSGVCNRVRGGCLCVVLCLLLLHVYVRAHHCAPDRVQRVYGHWWLDGEVSESVRRASIALFGCVVMLPLGLARSMTTLARSSILSLAAVVWIVAVVFVRTVGSHGGASVPEPHTRANRVTVVAPNLFSAIAVPAFAFVCHHNSFLVFNSMKVGGGA
jgi:amino acid permease